MKRAGLVTRLVSFYFNRIDIEVLVATAPVRYARTRAEKLGFLGGIRVQRLEIPYFAIAVKLGWIAIVGISVAKYNNQRNFDH